MDGPPAATHFTDRRGGRLLLRPAHEGDLDGLRAFFGQLSKRALYSRFLGSVRRVSEGTLERMVRPDGERAATVLALGEEDGVVRGVAQYALEAPGVAEAAFVVDDEFQGRGIATELLYHLADHARAHGIRSFSALVLADNTDMLRVFRVSGFPVSHRLVGTEECVEIDISQPPAVRPWEPPAV